jgi:hypothetical protein
MYPTELRYLHQSPLGSPISEPGVAREEQLLVARVVGHLAVEHCLAGRAMQGHLKIRKEGSPAPDGERPEERPIFTHFRHERVLHPKRRSQVSRERGEEALTDFCFDPFDDREQDVFRLSATADLSRRGHANRRRFPR